MLGIIKRPCQTLDRINRIDWIKSRAIAPILSILLSRQNPSGHPRPPDNQNVRADMRKRPPMYRNSLYTKKLDSMKPISGGVRGDMGRTIYNSLFDK